MIRGRDQQMMMKIDFKLPCGRRAASSELAEWPLEAKRAYIGSYVISRSYSLVFRRFDVLKYTDTLEEYALSLADNPLAPSDPTLIHYVRLLKYTEDVCDTFSYADVPHISKNSNITFPFIIKSLNKRLDDLRSAIPPSLPNTSQPLTYAHLSFQAYTHEISLYLLPSTPNTPLDTFQTNLLLSCLQSVKAVLDATASITDWEIQSMPGYSLARLQYLFHLAVELTLGVDSPSWDANMVRDVLKLEIYIEEFCIRIDRNALLISNAEGTEGNWYQNLAANWRAIKSQYLNELAKKGILVPQTDTQTRTEIHTQTEGGIQQRGMQAPEEMGHDGLGLNAAFSTDFWAVDFIPPWYGAVPMGNGHLVTNAF